MTSYIENDKESELLFDENGELLEKKNEVKIETENFYNKNFKPLPEDCKSRSLEEARNNKIVNKIGRFRNSVSREKIFTSSDKVCLLWKPGTIFSEYSNSNTYQIYVLLENDKLLFLYSTIDKTREGKLCQWTFDIYPYNNTIELLALPEEYIHD